MPEPAYLADTNILLRLVDFQGYCVTKRDGVILSEAKDLLFFEVSNPLLEKQILRADQERRPSE